MRDTGLLAWFGSMGRIQRASLVSGVMAAVEELDPGLAFSKTLWQRGKTARFEAALPLPGGPRTVGIHVVAHGNDARLWPTLRRRADAGDLVFNEGRTVMNDGPSVSAMVAPLGMGSLSVVERDGELMLIATAAQPVAMPVGFAVGAPLAFGVPDGVFAKLFAGQLVCVIGFSAPQRTEISALATSSIRLGLLKASPGLALICLNIPGMLDGWADLPFSMAIEPADARRLTPPGTDGRMTLPIILADTLSGLVMQVRVVATPSAWSYRLLDLVEEHAALHAYGRPDYDRDIAAARARWPSASSIAAALAGAAVLAEAL